jgi:hypothetical protein
MPTHAEVCDAVEKYHSGCARLIDGSTQQSTDNRVGATRLVHDSAAKVVMFISKAFETIHQRIITELWSTTDNHTRWLTARV